ncbi:MAG: hypothetical protein FWG53_07710 [Clostridiales bacterium]|nr:hypothetical protein [Clostridiales bacterium]
MLRRIVTEEIAAFMIWFIELASIEFYDKDKALAFKDLNERKIWHHFIEKYEEKRILPASAIIDEAREMLGREKTTLSNAGLLNDGDTEFIRKIVKALAIRYNWNYSVSLDKFYASQVCRISSGANVGLSAFGIEEMLELFDRELGSASDTPSRP